MTEKHFKTERFNTFVVAMTGGIASGKSTISKLFESLGIPVIDTDLIARKAVNSGSIALQKICKAFGSEFIHEDGSLNRPMLRNEIFSNPASRKKLNSILHPIIQGQVIFQLGLIEAPYCLLVVPLLAESSSYDWVDRILVVDVPEEIQLKRVMARDQISKRTAESILDSQASRQERLNIAEDIIENEGSISRLESRVTKLHKKYLSLSKKNRVQKSVE